MNMHAMGVSLRARYDATQVMLGVSLRTRFDTTIVVLIIRVWILGFRVTVLYPLCLWKLGNIRNTQMRYAYSSKFPRGHYLVWWVRVMISNGVRIRVRIDGRVRVRVMVVLEVVRVRVSLRL